MAANVEIKARVHDPDALRARAAALADGPARRLEQTDTFFTVPVGRLKLREFGDGTAELIQYRRPDAEGPKLSRYRRLEVPDPAGLEAALSAALGLRAVVVKRREVLMSGRTRIHLDAVEGLGDFLELEVVLAAGEAPAAGEAEARDLMARLGIAPTDLVTGAYVDLLEAGAVASGDPVRTPEEWLAVCEDTERAAEAGDAVLTGRRVTLRPATPADRDAVYAWMAHSDVTEALFGPAGARRAPVPSRAEHDADYAAHFFEGSRPERGRSFLIEADGETVGHVSYDRLDELHGVAELDIWMKDAASCGHGWGSDALDALARHLGARCGARACLLRPSAANARAIAAYAGAGFRRLELTAAEHEARFGPPDEPGCPVLWRAVGGGDGRDVAGDPGGDGVSA